MNKKEDFHSFRKSFENFDRRIVKISFFFFFYGGKHVIHDATTEIYGISRNVRAPRRN